MAKQSEASWQASRRRQPLRILLSASTEHSAEHIAILVQPAAPRRHFGGAAGAGRTAGFS